MRSENTDIDPHGISISWRESSKRARITSDDKMHEGHENRLQGNIRIVIR
jgi:hypothetical protein